jgi:hypothetical protein
MYRVLSKRLKIKEMCRSVHSMNKSDTLPKGCHPQNGSRQKEIERERERGKGGREREKERASAKQQQGKACATKTQQDLLVNMAINSRLLVCKVVG